jgi:hypothetical protein
VVAVVGKELGIVAMVLLEHRVDQVVAVQMELTHKLLAVQELLVKDLLVELLDIVVHNLLAVEVVAALQAAQEELLLYLVLVELEYFG